MCMRQCVCVDACVRSVRSLGNIVIHRGSQHTQRRGSAAAPVFSRTGDGAHARVSRTVSPPTPSTTGVWYGSVFVAERAYSAERKDG